MNSLYTEERKMEQANDLIVPDGYTLEVYKKDRRMRTGERRILKEDYATDNLSMLEHTVKHTWPASKGFRCEIHKTYVVAHNAMNGVPFVERYDVPFYCSPRSETYWSS
jgi:hypothetical protein